MYLRSKTYLINDNNVTISIILVLFYILAKDHENSVCHFAQDHENKNMNDMNFYN